MPINQQVSYYKKNRKLTQNLLFSAILKADDYGIKIIRLQRINT